MANIKDSTQDKSGNGAATRYADKMQSFGEQMGSAAEHAGERIGSMASNVADTTMNTVRTSEKYVQDHPIKGVAIAAATGFVVGSLFTVLMRSNRRDRD